MFAFFANMFGYILNFIYEIVKNYGLSIIIFSILIKIILLPISIKQQKTMQKTTKINEQVRQLQFKYKNNPEMLNKETMALYKRENMSPLSGCFSSIIQIILLLSVFFLVQSPLTYMRKVDTTVIEDYKSKLIQDGQAGGNIKYPEINIIKENGQEDERVYIIPVLYVISSIASMKISTNMTKKKKKEENGNEEKNEMDAIEEANKNMMYIMPVMAVSVSLIAPLGLALYWLVNNLLMIIEKVIMNKIIKTEGEENA